MSSASQHDCCEIVGSSVARSFTNWLFSQLAQVEHNSQQAPLGRRRLAPSSTWSWHLHWDTGAMNAGTEVGVRWRRRLSRLVFVLRLLDQFADHVRLEVTDQLALQTSLMTWRVLQALRDGDCDARPGPTSDLRNVHKKISCRNRSTTVGQ